MRFIWKQQKRTEGLTQTQTMYRDDKKSNSGLTTGVEKGFSEAFLFIFSVILHLSHSLKEEHGARS